MAIPTELSSEAYRGHHTAVPYKAFTLSGLSDTVGLKDPQDTSLDVTARGIRSNVAGTLSLVDIWGNISVQKVAEGELILGLYNGVRSTGTVTIVAGDVTIYL